MTESTRYLRELARHGAIARHAAIVEEMAQLRAFLQASETTGGVQERAAGASHTTRGRRMPIAGKRVVSADTRRRLSLAMRRSWRDRHVAAAIDQMSKRSRDKRHTRRARCGVRASTDRRVSRPLRGRVRPDHSDAGRSDPHEGAAHPSGAHYGRSPFAAPI